MCLKSKSISKSESDFEFEFTIRIRIQTQSSSSNSSSSSIWNSNSQLKSDVKFKFRSQIRIQHVKYLDLSGNAISKLPKSIIKLSSLDTLVLNRNSFSSMEELGDRLKSMRLQHLIIDGDTTVSREDFEYRLPGTTIEWRKEKLSHNYFVLPRNNYLIKKYRANNNN